MTLNKALTFGLVLVSVNRCTRSQGNAATQESASTPGFSIVIAAPDSPFRITGPVSVTITVTNDTNHVILWESDFTTDPQSACAAFRYNLERNGREVETTFFHRKISGRQRPDDPNEVYSPSSILLPHAPGRMSEMRIDLKRLYQINELGDYTLQVGRYDAATKTTVRSNKLTLEIAR